MKKKLLYITFIALFSIGIQAQQQQRENIKILKISYITDALNLTSSEAEKFWPVYNFYSDKIIEAKFSLETNMLRKIKREGGINNVTEEEASQYLKSSTNTEKEILKNKIELIEKLSPIISSIKILKLKNAERDFNRKMLHEYGKRKRMQMQQH